ncbi:hypothetical protein BX600DRAFT_537274 [Xylariales sp. PMI_506]|nr:hypothetical protein BX600DRAFT_537274 [Xylariales sp. PMI_506]
MGIVALTCSSTFCAAAQHAIGETALTVDLRYLWPRELPNRLVPPNAGLAQNCPEATGPTVPQGEPTLTRGPPEVVVVGVTSLCGISPLPTAPQSWLSDLSLSSLSASSPVVFYGVPWNITVHASQPTAAAAIVYPPQALELS